MPGMNPRTPTRRNTAATAVAAFCMSVAVMLRVVVSVMQRGYPPQVRMTRVVRWRPSPRLTPLKGEIPPCRGLLTLLRGVIRRDGGDKPAWSGSAGQPREERQQDEHPRPAE